MKTAEYKTRLDEYRALTEKRLGELFSDMDEDIAPLGTSMRYSLLAGGKRLRPVFVLEFARLCGCGDALDLACAIELLHTYSLIHDDLPCMDDDDLRRGMPTNHKKFGEWQALLSGDALQAEAFLLIAQAKLPDACRVEAIRILASAAGVGGICSGQYLDIEGEGKKQDVGALLRINRFKTSALISAACMMGCAAAGAFDERMTAAGKFGEALGLAFQIRDDILDVVGEEKVMGKDVGSDEKRGRVTFASLLGTEKASLVAADLASDAKTALRAGFEDTGFLEWLTDELTVRIN